MLQDEAGTDHSMQELIIKDRIISSDSQLELHTAPYHHRYASNVDDESNRTHSTSFKSQDIAWNSSEGCQIKWNRCTQIFCQRTTSKVYIMNPRMSDKRESRRESKKKNKKLLPPHRRGIHQKEVRKWIKNSIKAPSFLSLLVSLWSLWAGVVVLHEVLVEK